ncbi:MAG: hypothetical protein ACREQF_09785 [Candidatus Binataceae bacterium]
MSDRSFERIAKSDLKRLARIARDEREDYFGRHPEWAMLYRKRVLCSALCRDGALHFLNGTTGVGQFDVWTFYIEHAEAPFPYHRVSHRDFGESKFGSAAGQPAYEGRRVELNSRSLPCEMGHDPVAVLQQYLRRGETPSSRELREGAVVLIEPDDYLGYVVWPTLVVSVPE